MVRLNEDGGTDPRGGSFSGGGRAVLGESFPLFEPDEPPVSGPFGAFRFDWVGLVSAFSSPVDDNNLRRL